MYGADIIEKIKLEFRLWYRRRFKEYVKGHYDDLDIQLDEEIVNNYMCEQMVYGEELYDSLIEELKKLRKENEGQEDRVQL